MAAKRKAEADRVEVRSPHSPSYRSTLDGTKYRAVKAAVLKVTPRKAPGITQNELFVKILPHLPKEHFPGGAKAEWWAKSVQLDLEARGELVREATKPLRWHRAS